MPNENTPQTTFKEKTQLRFLVSFDYLEKIVKLFSKAQIIILRF